VGVKFAPCPYDECRLKSESRMLVRMFGNATQDGTGGRRKLLKGELIIFILHRMMKENEVSGKFNRLALEMDI